MSGHLVLGWARSFLPLFIFLFFPGSLARSPKKKKKESMSSTMVPDSLLNKLPDGVRESASIQMQIRRNAEEVHGMISDVSSWSKQLNALDVALMSGSSPVPGGGEGSSVVDSSSSSFAADPPIRGRAISAHMNHLPSSSSSFIATIQEGGSRPRTASHEMASLAVAELRFVGSSDCCSASEIVATGCSCFLSDCIRLSSRTLEVGGAIHVFDFVLFDTPACLAC